MPDTMSLLDNYISDDGDLLVSNPADNSVIARIKDWSLQEVGAAAEQADQALSAWANDTSYGLAAYFFTRDMARTIRVMEALEYGMVGVNEGIISTEVAPFGGVKESGIGREGSRYGNDKYIEMKYCLLGGI